MATAATQLRAVETNSAAEALQGVLARQQQAFRRNPPDYDKRMAALAKLAEVLKARAQDIADAINADFGNRSQHESILAEVMVLLEEIKHTRRKLKKWMKPSSSFADLNYLPARVRLMRQPVGVVGIIGAWNYPVQLTFGPAIGAIAAGNHIIMKPSEFGPTSAKLMQDMIAEAFPEDYITVVTGGADVSAALSALPLDHLVFTGSTRTGKLVMQAAAKNLTPVTLELGGKSPAILGYDFDMEKTAMRMMSGKMFNAGQTCIAPDYVLVPENRKKELVQAIRNFTAKAYPRFANNPDYTTIIHDNHYQRLSSLLDDAREKGATIQTASTHEEAANETLRVLPPTLVTDVNDDMLLMQEEIFGPILPIRSYKTIDEAIDIVNNGDRPLALYYFGNSKTERERVLNETISGGVSVNETLFHQPQSSLPFGGIGPSGMGAYHGHHGFLQFSKEKGVFLQSSFNPLDWMRAPYGPFMNAVLRLLTGWKAK